MGHWTLDSTLDSTPSGQPGTAEQTSFVPGVDGNAADMPGEPNYIVSILGSETSYNNFHLGLSVSMWVNTTHDGWQILAGKQDRTPELDATSWTLNLNPAGLVNLTGQDGGIAGVFSTASVNDGEWHLVTVTFDGGVRKVYIDGLLDAETGAQGAIDTADMNTQPFEIGGESVTGAAPAQSILDDVRVYNYALAATDVVDLYNEFEGPISACILEYAQFVDIANSDTGLVAGDEGFEQDCKVNLDDFAAMAAGWLSCGLYPNCP